MIVPENSACYRSSEMVNEGKEGLVVVRHMDSDAIVSEMKLIDKAGLEDLIVEQEIKLHKKADIEPEAKDAFDYGWNDYL